MPNYVITPIGAIEDEYKIEPIGKADSILETLGKSFMRGAARVGGGLLDFVSFVGEGITGKGKVWDYMRQVGKEAEEYWSPQVEPGSAKYYAGEIVSTATQNLMNLLFGGWRALPSLGLMGIEASGQKAVESLEKGASYSTAAAAGAISGASEVATEFLPITKLLKPGERFFSRLLKVSAADVPGELINTAIEMKLIDEALLGSNYTVDDYKNALIDTALISFGSSALMAGAAHPVIRRLEQLKQIPIEEQKYKIEPVEEILKEGEQAKREYIQRQKQKIEEEKLKEAMAQSDVVMGFEKPVEPQPEQTITEEVQSDKEDKTGLPSGIPLGETTEQTKSDEETGTEETQTGGVFQTQGQVGAFSYAYTPEGKRIEYKFAVLPADALITSHDTEGRINPAFPQELQPRQREKKASQLQIQQIAQNIKPELLEEAKTVTEGAPIVGDDLVVESGNARALGIKMAYDIGTGQYYKNYLIENAEKFGLRPEDIEKIDKPVLVRIRTTPVDRSKFTKVANERTTLSMSPAEIAEIDAQRLPDTAFESLIVTEDGNLLNPSNRRFIQTFLSSLPYTEQAQYVTDTGYTKQLHDRMQSAIFAKAYQDRRLIALQAEEADVDIKNILTGLTYAAPEFAKIRAKYKDLGSLDLDRNIVEAAEIIREIKRRGMSFEMWKAQGGLFGSQYEPASVEIAEYIVNNIRSSKKIALFLEELAKELHRELDFHAQDNLLGIKPRTKEEILHEIRKKETVQQQPKQSTIYQAEHHRESKEESRGEIERGREEEVTAEEEKQEKKGTTESFEYLDGKVVINYTKDRVQIFFNEKPSQEIIQNLKNKNWHWSPKEKAWQRKITDRAIWEAKELFKSFEAGQETIDISKPAQRAYTTEELEEIIRHIQRIVAPGTEIQIVERIEIPEQSLKAALQRWGLGDLNAEVPIAGLHRVVKLDGHQFKAIIQLSLDYMNKTTPYHEAFHNVQKFLLTDEEIERLKRRYPAKDGISSSERQAEAFAKYALGRRNQPVWVRRIFEKIKAFLDSLANFLRGRGWRYEDVSDIFEKAYRGELRQRYERGEDLGLDIDYEAQIDPDSIDLSVAEAARKLMKRLGLKGAENVIVAEKRPEIGLIKAFLSSPSKIAGKMQYYVVHAKNAVRLQDRLRGMAKEKLDEIFKGFKKRDFEEFAAISWMGDMEGKVYSAEELKEMGISEKVAKAYLEQRRFHDRVWRLLSAHRKQYGLETGYLRGHVPHFFENWNVYELKEEQDPETGELRLVPAGIVGTFRSLRGATEFANSLDPKKKYLIKPKTFSLPLEMRDKTVLKDASYWKLVQQIEDNLSLSREEAQEIVNSIARVKNRHRFLGNLMKRTGQTGFVQDDIRKILEQYYFMVARYIALDEFKARVIPKFEKDFGVEFGRAQEAVRDNEIARQVEKYIQDVNGVPGEIERLIDNSIKKAFGKYIRSERPTIWTVNKLLHYTAVVKLGLFNLSTAIVNLTQMLNTFSKVPSHVFAWAFKEAIKPSLKSKGILKKLGVQFDIGLTETGGYSWSHRIEDLGKKSMILFTAFEIFNRRVTALAGYRAAVEKGMTHRQALQYARELVDTTQFDYSVADTQRIFRNPVGRLLGQFKPFAVKQLEFVLGLRGVENIKFWIPFLLMAGAAGVPFLGLLNEVIEWLTGKDPYTEVKKELMEWAAGDKDKEKVANVLLYGVGSVLGVDISKRIGLADIAPQRWNDLLGVSINTMLNAKRLAEQSTFDATEFVRNIAPAVGNLLTAIETVANDMQVFDPWNRQHLKYEATPSDVAVKAFGFRPVRESILSDIEQIRQYETKQYRKESKEIIDDIVDGIFTNNPEKIVKAMDKAIQKGITIDKRQLKEQIMGRMMPQDMRMIRQTPRMLRPEYMELIEYGK